MKNATAVYSIMILVDETWKCYLKNYLIMSVKLFNYVSEVQATMNYFLNETVSREAFNDRQNISTF